MFNSLRVPLLSCFILCYLPPGLAQDKPVESITVYASRSGDNPKNIPAYVQIIDREQIENWENAGENLSTLLGKLVPGFGAPTQSVSNFGQNLRGREVLILIDGISQAENRQVSRQLNSISIHNIERIEVMSGANAMYGAGAPGGIINIISKDYSKKSLSLQTSIGSSVATKPVSSTSQDSSFQQLISGTLSDFSYLASIGIEQRNNIFDANGEQVAPEPAQTSRGDTTSYDGLLKIAEQLTSKQKIEFNLNAFQETQDTDFTVQIEPYRAEKGLELEEQPFSKRLQAVLLYENKDLFTQKLLTQLYFREREYGFFPFELKKPVPIVNQSRSKSELYGFKATLNKAFDSGLNLTYGVDYELEKSEQKAHSYNQLQYEISGGKVYTGKSQDYDYGPAIDTQKTALFAQLQLGLTKSLKTRFGYRFEHIEQNIHDFTPPFETAIGSNWAILYAGIAQMESLGKVPVGTTASLPKTYRSTNFEGGQRAYDASAYNLGFIQDLTANQQLYFNFSQGFELADTARLLRDAVAADSLIPVISPIFKLSLEASAVSSLELDTITTSHYEGGWRGDLDTISGNLAIFYNESDKVYQFNRDFTVDLLDRKKRIYGAEGSLRWRLAESSTLDLSHSQNKGEFRRSNGKGWTAVSAMELSPPKTTFGFSQGFSESLTAELLAQNIAAYNKADDVDIKAYTTLDLHVLYRWTDLAQMKLGILNLLNEEYKTVFHQWAEATYGPASGAPASGRRISLMFRLNF